MAGLPVGAGLIQFDRSPVSKPSWNSTATVGVVADATFDFCRQVAGGVLGLDLVAVRRARRDGVVAVGRVGTDRSEQGPSR